MAEVDIARKPSIVDVDGWGWLQAQLIGHMVDIAGIKSQPWGHESHLEVLALLPMRWVYFHEEPVPIIVKKLSSSIQGTCCWGRPHIERICSSGITHIMVTNHQQTLILFVVHENQQQPLKPIMAQPRLHMCGSG